MSAWRVGQVLGLRLQCAAGSVFHLGSAGLVDAELAGVRADVALLCTIGRRATPRFVHRALDLLQPKLVVPCHWDRFWRPIDEPAREIPGNDLAGFIQEVQAHASRPEVRVAGIRGWVRVS
jgi:L-ascorbate metabolism protein UlaG (beta-lactamase superfamily)